jgi:surfactin synthase thioesterase subunit
MVSRMQPKSNPWIVCRRPDAAAPARLFCFPYAGGGSMIYHRWPDGLKGVAEVLAVQPPGRESRMGEKPYTRLTDMCEGLYESVLPLLDRPFVFFGHSMGAVLAFELARMLAREAGREPLHLYVSARDAPQLPSDEPETYNLPEPEFIDYVINLNGTPREVLENAELRQLVLPPLRADFSVCQTYRFGGGQPLGCPITAFGGLSDRIGRERLEAWREHTASAFELRMFPGDHFFVNTELQSVLAVIARDTYRHLGELGARDGKKSNNLTGD